MTLSKWQCKTMLFPVYKYYRSFTSILLSSPALFTAPAHRGVTQPSPCHRYFINICIKLLLVRQYLHRNGNNWHCNKKFTECTHSHTWGRQRMDV